MLILMACVMTTNNKRPINVIFPIHFMLSYYGSTLRMPHISASKQVAIISNNNILQFIKQQCNTDALKVNCYSCM